jgi:hypothetical protein
MGPHVLRPGETLMLGENVSLVFGVGYDADATMVSAAAVQPPAYQAPPQRQATYQPPQRQVSPQVYTGQIPYGPPAQAEEPEEEGGRNFKPLIYAGCGCLLALVCLIAGAVAFDWLDLYCTGPFSALQPLYSLWGGTCP